MEPDKMKEFWQEIESATHIAIGGHIRPDGDCVGSCMGLANYLMEHYPDKSITVYLGEYDPAFHFLKNLDKVTNCINEDEVERAVLNAPEYDLFLALDTSNLERLEFEGVLKKAKKTVCVDHHITNEGYAGLNLVFVSSSTAEAIYDLIDYQEKNIEDVSLDVAECLYLGIVHDTGVFKHSNTTRHTMEAAGALVGIGVDTSKVIDDTFYRKTYVQNLLLGRALLESSLTEDGKIISAVVTKEMFAFYGANKTDLEGIVDQLRITEGVEVAVFAYETPKGDFKYSLRSNTTVDVSKVCVTFGGGGHVRASGCTIDGTFEVGLDKIKKEIYKQL